MIRIAGELLGLGVTRIEPAGNSVAPFCDRDAQVGHETTVSYRPGVRWGICRFT